MQFGYLLQCTLEYSNFLGGCFGSSDWDFQTYQIQYKMIGTRKIVPAQVLASKSTGKYYPNCINCITVCSAIIGYSPDPFWTNTAGGQI